VDLTPVRCKRIMCILVPSDNIALPTRPIVVLCILKAWERSPTTFKNKITQIARTGRHEAPATASPQGHGWLDRNISWSSSLRLFQRGWTPLHPIISLFQMLLRVEAGLTASIVGQVREQHVNCCASTSMTPPLSINYAGRQIGFCAGRAGHWF
jgi:hypothetical protein